MLDEGTNKLGRTLKAGRFLCEVQHPGNVCVYKIVGERELAAQRNATERRNIG